LKIGLHVGPVATGVIGTKTFSYDVWGDTVNIASRMETTGKDGFIQVTNEIYEALVPNTDFKFELRGNVYVKGKGILNTYYLRTGGISTTLLSSQTNLNGSTEIKKQPMFAEPHSSLDAEKQRASEYDGQRLFKQGTQRKSSSTSHSIKHGKQNSRNMEDQVENSAIAQTNSTSKSIHTGSQSIRSDERSLLSANNSRSIDISTQKFERKLSVRKNEFEMKPMPEGDATSLLSIIANSSGSKSAGSNVGSNRSGSGSFNAKKKEGRENYVSLNDEKIEEGSAEDVKDWMIDTVGGESGILEERDDD
jgi:hypothetical protein